MSLQQYTNMYFQYYGKDIIMEKSRRNNIVFKNYASKKKNMGHNSPVAQNAHKNVNRIHENVSHGYHF